MPVPRSETKRRSLRFGGRMSFVPTRQATKLTGLSTAKLRKRTSRRALIPADVPPKARGSPAWYSWQTVLLLRLTVTFRERFRIELQARRGLFENLHRPPAKSVLTCRSGARYLFCMAKSAGACLTKKNGRNPLTSPLRLDLQGPGDLRCDIRFMCRVSSSRSGRFRRVRRGRQPLPAAAMTPQDADSQHDGACPATSICWRQALPAFPVA